MAHAFQAVVVEVDMGYLHLPLRQAGDIDAEAVVLAGDFDMAGGQIFYRLVAAAMTEFEFVGGAAVGQAEHLMAKTDAEDRHFAEQGPDGLDDAFYTRRVAGAVGQKNPVRLHGQNRFGTGSRRHHLDPAALFGQ